LSRLVAWSGSKDADRTGLPYDVDVDETEEADTSGDDHVSWLGRECTITFPSSPQLTTLVPVRSVEMSLMRAVCEGRWRSSLPRWSRTYSIPLCVPRKSAAGWRCAHVTESGGRMDEVEVVAEEVEVEVEGPPLRMFTTLALTRRYLRSGSVVSSASSSSEALDDVSETAS